MSALFQRTAAANKLETANQGPYDNKSAKILKTCNACTTWSTGRKLGVKVEGIIDAADDWLEWRNDKTSIQPVKIDRRKEWVTFYIANAGGSSAWQEHNQNLTVMTIFQANLGLVNQLTVAQFLVGRMFFQTQSMVTDHWSSSFPQPLTATRLQGRWFLKIDPLMPVVTT